MNKIKKGDIAICGVGKVGMITDSEKQDVILRNGKLITTYVGVQLTNGMVDGVLEDVGQVFEFEIGDSWSSKHPIVIGHIEDIVKDLLIKHEMDKR